MKQKEGKMAKVTQHEIVKAKNNIFVKKGIPTLLSNGFEKSPYKTSWYGKEGSHFFYSHCKLLGNSKIVHLETHIMKGDAWIQNYLNIFELLSPINNLKQLENSEGIKFGIPPLVNRRMRLKLDGYKIIPLFVDLFIKQHKIGGYYTRLGFEKRIEELGNLIEEDFNNIDKFIDLWFKNNKPLVTTWDGEIVGLASMTPHERLVHTNLLKEFNQSTLENKVIILRWLSLDEMTIKKFLQK